MLFMCSARARRCRAQCDVLVIRQFVTILPHIICRMFVFVILLIVLVLVLVVVVVVLVLVLVLVAVAAAAVVLLFLFLFLFLLFLQHGLYIFAFLWTLNFVK